MNIYRAWVNQPSGLQPLHSLHGKRGIMVEQPHEITMHFTEGKIHSMQVCKLWISRGKLSSAEG